MYVTKTRLVMALAVVLMGMGAPRAMAQAPAPARQREANLVLIGKEDLPGYGPLTFRIVSRSEVQMIDKDGTSQGTWKVNGSQIQFCFYKGTVIYDGTVTGESISGTASNGDKTWNWRVQTAPENVGADAGAEEVVPAPRRMPPSGSPYRGPPEKG